MKSSFSEANSEHPDCIAPSNAAITNFSSSNVTIGWSGTKATPTGIRYIVRSQHITSDGKVGDWKESWILNGKSYNLYDVGEAGTYRVELKRICDGENTNYELSSEWTPVGSVTYNENSLAESGICDSLNSFSVSQINGPIAIVNWDGPIATIDGPRYIIRHREVGASDWNEDFIFSGETHTLVLIPSTTFEVEIKLIDGGEAFDYTNECPWLSAGSFTTECGECYIPPDPTPEDENEISLPDFNCGDTYEEPPAEEGTPLASAQAGDIFTIGGFPILLEEVTGANGTFSGKGLVPLPFGEKILSVEFANVSVNADAQIYQGQVNGIQGNPLPNLNSVIESGEICLEIPDQQPVDENGFNTDNQYGIVPPYDGWTESDSIDLNFDPNGFNVSGIHVQTGTVYNPDGCSQQGIDAQGQPCSFDNGPYYWLNGSQTTAEGVAFASQIEGTFPTQILALLNQIHTETLDSVSTISTVCQGVRNEMNVLVQTLGHNRNKLFGENDKYFNEGMHQYFKSEPKVVSGIQGRDLNQIELEDKHKDLFQCDSKLYNYKHVDTVLTTLKTNPEFDLMVSTILDFVKTLHADSVLVYQSDSTAFENWIISQLQVQITLSYNNLYTVNEVDNNFNSWANNKKPNNSIRINPTNFTASNDYSFFENIDNSLSPEDVRFQYLQGWEYIGDVHRAYYLEAIINERKKNNSSVNPNPENLLPLSFTKVIASREHTIIFDNIVLTPLGATVDAYMILEVPTSGDKLVFRGLNISFGPTGTQGDSELSLETDIQIRLNNAARLTLKGTPKTFVSWNCDGFLGMGIDAEIEFCRKYLIPLDSITLDALPEPDLVKGRFSTTMPTWGEVIVDIDIDPFAISKYEEVKWQILNAKIDFSDTANPDGIVFPEGYQSPHVNNGTASKLWKGFYLGELSVTIPKSLTGGGSGTPTTIAVNDVIIDDMGVSGKLAVSPIFTLEQGDLNGWAYSLDTFKLEVMANQFEEAGFNGLIHIPIAKGQNNNTDDILPEDCLQYTAIIQPDNNYYFSLSPLADDYKVDMWKADIYFDSLSTIDVSYVNGEFLTRAKLTGQIDINGNFTAGKSVQMDDVQFQNLELSNQQPYIKTGFWSFPDGPSNKLAGFSYSIDSISLSSNPAGTEIDLNFNVLLGLTGNDIGVSALGGFTLQGELETNDNKQKWKYKDFNINTLAIDASFPGVESLVGVITFYDEDVDTPTYVGYGTGFRGAASMKVRGLDAEIEAVAQFGKKPLPGNPDENFKYFFVDAMVNIADGINVGGGLKIQGFGGGVYYHMNRPASSIPPLPVSPTGNNISIPTGLGVSLSGIQYTPDHTKGLGLKATVALSLVKEQMFNANASFEILFNDGSGVSDIWFYGNFRSMSDMDVTAAPTASTDSTITNPNNGAPISGFIDIHYNFGNPLLNLSPSLDANFQIHLIAAGGIIKGEGNDNKFGGGEFYFGDDGWYINFGKPSDRNTAILTVPGTEGGLLTLTSYFCMGTNIEPMPELPANVQELSGAGNFMANESMRASGVGIAFGASVDINTGDKDFLIFYGNFSAGAGYDLMLQRYDGAYCIETGEQLGINGFYASGQAYAYIQGEIGVKWKGNKFEILSIGAAAVLQAKLPNPFWAKGTVGGHYSVLGGIVKGECQFDIIVGESCTIAGADEPMADLEVIMNISPVDQATNISGVFTPSAIFNIPIEREFELPNLTTGTDTYFVELTSAQIIHNGVVLPALDSIAYDGLSLTMEAIDMLPANDSLFFQVEVKVWKNAVEEVNTELRVVKFYTGEGLPDVPTQNILASYPSNGQFNFLKEEYNEHKGYIMLKKGQPDLFDQPTNTSTLQIPSFIQNVTAKKAVSNGTSNKTLKAVLSHNGEVVNSFPATYDNDQRIINYDLPPDDLENETLYKLEIKYVLLGGSINEYNEPALATTFFRTSAYNTLNAKLDAISLLNPQISTFEWTPPGEDKSIKDVRIYLVAEYFDQLEMSGIIGYGMVPTDETNYNVYFPVLGLPWLFDLPLILESHYDENSYPPNWDFDYDPSSGGGNLGDGSLQSKGFRPSLIETETYNVIFRYNLPGKGIITNTGAIEF